MFSAEIIALHNVSDVINSSPEFLLPKLLLAKIPNKNSSHCGEENRLTYIR